MKRLKFLLFLLFVPFANSFDRPKLPDFEGLEFSTDKRFQFNQYKGKIIYLDFWASWCAPCVESLPFMEKLYQRYATQGFEIIAINIDEKKVKADEFLKNHPISYLNLYDPKGKIGQQLKVRNMPTAFLIDREGNILFKHVGFDQEYSKKLEQAIRKLVKIK